MSRKEKRRSSTTVSARKKNNAVFNLDTVEGVGQIFEVEAQARDNWDPDQQVQEYLS